MIDDLALLPPKRSKRARGPSLISQGTSFLDAFDGVFKDHFSGDTWAAWRACGAALFGEPMTDDELAIYRDCTKRTDPPATPTREAYLEVGRRGGKSSFAAAVAVFRACVRPPKLKKGTVGVVMVLAVDRDQADVVFSYIEDLIDSVPQFKAMVKARSRDTIDLRNGVRIAVMTADWRRVRGRTVILAICDEVAFWYSAEASANPDREIMSALRPSTLGVEGAMILCISSPYGQQGVMWDAHQRYYGRDDSRVLVWNAATWTMRPNVDMEELDRARELDPVAYESEFGARFREDLAGFVGPEVLAALVIRGRVEMPWTAGVSHHGFLDAAGGGGRDSLTLGIARHDRVAGKEILVALFEWRPPFSATDVAGLVAERCRQFRVREVVGDRFSGATWQDILAGAGITMKFTDHDKSEIYVLSLPLLTGGKVELLDHPRMIGQALALERRTGSSGRDTVTHPPRGNDDLVNAALGALLLCFEKSRHGSGVVVASVVRSHTRSDDDDLGSYDRRYA